ncbi:hypothetical protein BC835DRAFT_1422407 [Cytidiella melzeri]|nr:hypothetical protein BC835DRAFT_1422407 [Cytidiella melzeri]
MSLASVVVKAGRAFAVARAELNKAHNIFNPTLAALVPYILSSIVFHLNTLFLFIASDVYAYLLPIISYAWAISPSLSLSRVVSAAFWLLLHLLQYGTATQYLSATKDKLTAPHLPIPAGRTTKSHTETLRWLLLPVCLAQSLRYGVPIQGMAAMVIILALNELKFIKSWLMTALLRVALFVVLESAVLVFIGHRSSTPITYLYPLLALTTFHVHDSNTLRTRRPAASPVHKLDLPIGKAVPTVPPSGILNRLFTLVALPMWSLFLSLTTLSGTSSAKAVFLAVVGALLLGLYVGIRFWYQSPTKKSSGVVNMSSFNLWYTLVRILPAVL